MPGMIDFTHEDGTSMLLSTASDDAILYPSQVRSVVEATTWSGGERDLPKTSLRPPSRLVFPLLMILVPASVFGVLLVPVLGAFSLIPVLGFFSLPSLISLCIFLSALCFLGATHPPLTPTQVYSLSWTSYLLLAQYDPPTNVRLPFLPWSPFRAFRVTIHLLRLVRDFIAAGAIDLFLDLQVRRVMVLGGKDAKRVVKENILYADGGKRLDVYFPFGAGPTSVEDGDETLERAHVTELVPVIVFLGGGNWSWWKKQWGSQAALRLRKLGFCVVVPDMVQWPLGKSPEMVHDFRRVLEWTGERIQGYGGDPDKIFVMDAVVRSRDEHLARTVKPHKLGHSPEYEISVSTGIRRCRIWGEEARLPPIAGLIFVSGVFDIIKQMRFEAKAGIEDLSSLRRACGPSSAASLLSCPSHLLFGAKEIIEPDRLPPKILIIAGGADAEVPYAQSVLMRTLLTGIGLPHALFEDVE
ncbi:hypothetical protein P7C70_g1249, partial [Phenoliferia sp. Uapishka_3]